MDDQHAPELVDVPVPDVDQPDDVDAVDVETDTPLGWIVYVDPVDGTRNRVTVEHYRTLNL